MGLNLNLEVRKGSFGVTPDTETEGRLNIAGSVLSYYSNYFQPHTLKIWRGAPLQSLGGTQAREIPITRKITEELLDLKRELTRYSWQEKQELIFQFIGDWTIDKITIEGFLNVNNKGTWRSTYGDIEFNIYPTKQFPDLIYLLKRDTTLEKQLVHDFLAEFPQLADSPPFRISAIYFGVGVPSKYEVTSLTGAYYGSEDTLIKDSVRTMIDEQGEKVSASFTPYKESFLISGLNDVPAFRQFLNDALTRHEITKEKTGSIVLIGRNLDSFKQFYDELSINVLKPVADDLPNKPHLLEIIKNAVERKTSKQQKLKTA